MTSTLLSAEARKQVTEFFERLRPLTAYGVVGSRDVEQAELARNLNDALALLAGLPEAPAVKVQPVAIAQVTDEDYEYPSHARVQWLLNPMPPGSLLYEAAPAQLQGEVSDARDAAELRFYRRWGYPFTDHSTMFDKDHEGLCAIMLPLSLPHPDGEGTCTATTIRAFTGEQLYEKARAHIAAISAKSQP